MHKYMLIVEDVDEQTVSVNVTFDLKAILAKYSRNTNMALISELWVLLGYEPSKTVTEAMRQQVLAQHPVDDEDYALPTLGEFANMMASVVPGSGADFSFVTADNDYEQNILIIPVGGDQPGQPLTGRR